jgi:hypothetical protein
MVYAAVYEDAARDFEPPNVRYSHKLCREPYGRNDRMGWRDIGMLGETSLNAQKTAWLCSRPEYSIHLEDSRQLMYSQRRGDVQVCH